MKLIREQERRYDRKRYVQVISESVYAVKQMQCLNKPLICMRKAIHGT